MRRAPISAMTSGLVGFSFCALWASAGDAAEKVVTAPETAVRTAPADIAPEVVRVRAGVVLPADEAPQGAWRRVRLPDGRYGFLRDADLQTPDPALKLAPTPAEEAFVVTPPAVVAAQAAPSPPSLPRREVGVMFELLPIGTLSATSTTQGQTMTGEADTKFALAVAPFLDVDLSPYISIGLSPQVIFGVKGDGATGQSAKEFDFRGRLTARAPLSPTVGVFGRLSSGYSIIDTPASGPNPSGPVVDVSVGTRVALLPTLSVVADLGYQAGFQSTDQGELHVSYLHLGAGLAVGF